jgi:hypothetical protein
MASSGISKGHETLDEKTHQLPDSSYGEPPVKQHYNTVTRGESIPSSDDINDNIVGYDGRLMGARTRLSSQQEKKLLRRIDWHLIPLLSVMYMVKSIDASNVSEALALVVHANVVGFECSNHGSRNAEEYHDGAEHLG